MKQNQFLLYLLGITLTAFLVLTVSNAWPRATMSRASPQVLSTPFKIYQPLILHNWFNRGPHFPLDYGPYRANQAPGGPNPSTAEISEDLSIIQPETKLIRLFGACDVLGTIPQLAEQTGIYLYQGVALSSSVSISADEMNCYTTLLSENSNFIGGIIGNETLLREDLTEANLISYINEAKQAGMLPVSTAETWGVWCNLHSQIPRCPGRPLLSNSVDFIVAHVYPYWEAVSIEHGAAHVIALYITLRVTYPDKEVVIGETGWPTCGNTLGGAVPSLNNQKRFIEDLWRWSNRYRVPVLYFEAFDEPWKAIVEGQVGGCWGLYDVNRLPKHSNLDWSLPLPESAPISPTVSIEHPQNLTSTVTDGDCSIPIFGRVEHSEPAWQVKVEVFTNQWYVQEKWYPNGLTPIIDGMWSMPEIVLGGQGQYNNHGIRVTLVDEFGMPQASDEVGGLVRVNSCTP